MKGPEFEYAVRRDIRNNPVVREVDRARHREMWRAARIGALLVVLLLFWAWQQFELVRYGYQIEELQRKHAAELQINRHLRLEAETLQSPARIERIATSRLRLVAPGAGDSVVVERVPASPPPGKAIVASR